MNYIGKIFKYVLLSINGLVILALLLSAYSSYISPSFFPWLSCVGLLFPVLAVVNLCFLFFWLLVCRKYALFSFLALVCCWGTVRVYMPINCFSSNPPKDAIKIISYNTRGFSDMKPHTKEKPNPVLEYLRNSDADIICIQEYIVTHQLKEKDVTYALKDYRYKHCYSLASGWNGLACFSKYPILSATPIVYDSEANGSIAYRIKVGKDTLLVINNHLESNKIHLSDVEAYKELVHVPNDKKTFANAKELFRKLMVSGEKRAGQAEQVRNFVEESKEKYVVVCGDFNDTSVSYTHRILRENLDDAFVESGNGFGFSYNQHQMYVRIDHILASKTLEVYRCWIDNTIDASDHYPISCYISFSKDRE